MSSRPLSFCCEPCMRRQEGCLNSAWVQGWKEEKLRRGGAGATTTTDEDELRELEEESWGDDGCAGARLAS